MHKHAYKTAGCNVLYGGREAPVPQNGCMTVGSMGPDPPSTLHAVHGRYWFPTLLVHRPVFSLLRWVNKPGLSSFPEACWRMAVCVGLLGEKAIRGPIQMLVTNPPLQSHHSASPALAHLPFAGMCKSQCCEMEPGDLRERAWGPRCMSPGPP